MKSRLILIFAGLVFFANPCFNMFDILPDFIGAVLVMWGLSGFIYFDANLESAHKSAKYLLWISIFKLVLCMWCNTGHREYIMPFTFIAAVLEAIFMISMFRGLYLGAEYTLMRSTSKQSPKAVNDAFTMSFIFTIASRILEFVPHIADIAAQDAELDLSHKASFKMPIAQMKIYLLGACLIFGLIVGLFYIAVTAKAWIKLIRDKEYNGFLKGKYEDFLKNDREVYVTRRISFAYTLITASIIFIPDFYVDAVNLIPTLITVLCLLGAAHVLCSLDGKRTNILFFFACIATVVVNGLYMSRVHLGINYICSVETFNKQEFSLLTSTMSITYALILCAAEAILVWGVLNYVLSVMKGVFEKEKRKNVLSRLFGMRILSALTLVLLALSRILTAVCGHFATHPDVTNYIKNKAFITSGKVYEEMIANPLVARYEDFVGYQSMAAIACLICLLLMLVICVNMKRATEGSANTSGL